MEVYLFLAICSFCCCCFKMQLPNALSFLGTQLRFCFETWIDCRANPFFSWTTCDFHPRNARKLFWKHLLWEILNSISELKAFPAGYTQRGFGSMWKLIKQRLLNRSTLCALHNLQRQKTGLLSKKARISYKLQQGSTNFSVRDQKINIWSFCGLYVLCWNNTTLWL